jgi:hypothetical protein
MSAKKKNSTAFRQGRFGACEARLYEFRGHAYPGDPDEETLQRIAAQSIFEGLQYLQRRDPDFEVVSVQCIGLVTLLSGATLD